MRSVESKYRVIYSRRHFRITEWNVIFAFKYTYGLAFGRHENAE